MPLDRPVALPAAGLTHPGEEHPQEVVHLGGGGDGGPGVGGHVALSDGDRGAEALDPVDVRFLHLFEELAGVRAE